jgi:DNA-binding XRE family transcriptional regulator
MFKRKSERPQPSGTFASRLQHLREDAGLSKYALAKKSGLTQQAVYLLEAARCLPTWSTVCKLAKALGVCTDAFVVDA